MSHRTRALGGSVAAAILALTLAGCGSQQQAPRQTEEPDVRSTPTAEATESPASGAKVIEITLTEDSVSPAGQRVAVDVDQPVVLRIEAARAGELHVHSSPERQVAFPAGSSEVTLVIDQPGIVDIEDHDLDKLIIQLEVS